MSVSRSRRSADAGSGCQSSGSRLTKLLLLVVGLLVAADCYQLAHVPAFGWDALQYWLPSSVDIMEGGDGDIDVYGSRHPKLLQHILVISYRLSEWASVPGSALSIYLVALIGIALFAATSVGTSERLLVFALTLFLVLTTPLFEAHLLVGGYTELFVCLFSVGFVCLGGKAMAGKTFRTLLPLMIFGVLLIASRNTGPVYFFVAAVAVIFGFHFRDRRWLVRSSIVTVAAILAIAALGWSLATTPEIRESVDVRLDRGDVIASAPACDAPDELHRIAVRGLRASPGEADLEPGLKPRYVHLATITGEKLEQDCEVAAGTALQDFVHLRIEAYSEDKALLWYGDLYPGTRRLLLPGEGNWVLIGRTSELKLFGYRMKIQSYEASVVAKSVFVALVKNMSFSIIFVAGLLLFITCLIARVPIGEGATLQGLNAVLLLIVFVLSQALIDRMFVFSQPSNDTFGSRFLMLPAAHMIVFVALLSCSLVRAASEPSRAHCGKGSV